MSYFVSGAAARSLDVETRTMTAISIEGVSTEGDSFLYSRIQLEPGQQVLVSVAERLLMAVSPATSPEDGDEVEWLDETIKATVASGMSKRVRSELAPDWSDELLDAVEAAIYRSFGCVCRRYAVPTLQPAKDVACRLHEVTP